jgi:arginine/lysine/ornithine decarboxylase
VAVVDLEHLTDQTLALLAVLVAVAHVSAQAEELVKLEVTVEEQQQVKEILAALVSQAHIHMAVAAVAQADQEMIDILQHQLDQLTMLQMVVVAMVDMEYNTISLAHALGMQEVAVVVVAMIILVMVKVD